MELVQWMYDHPQLAVAILAASIGVGKWAYGLYVNVALMAQSLQELSKNIKEHDSRLDNHEVRLALLEKGKSNG